MTIPNTSLLTRGDLEREQRHQEHRIEAAMATIHDVVTDPSDDWWEIERAIMDIREAATVLQVLPRIVPVDPF